MRHSYRYRWVFGWKLCFSHSVHRRIVGCKTTDAWPKQSCVRGNFWAPYFSWLSLPLIYNANRVAKYSSSTTKLKFIGNSTLFLTPVQIKLYSRIFTNRTSTMLENYRKSLIMREKSYVYILSGQKFIKNAKNGTFGEFLKPEACGQTVLPDR